MMWRLRDSCFIAQLGVIVLLRVPCYSLESKSCRDALGMQTGEIPDEALSSSSSLDPVNVGPTSSRIRMETSGGAWCPSQFISRNIYEYLQIDFGELKVISLIETQGRFGNGQGQEYAEQYQLNYRRQDNGHWYKFRNRRGQEIFQGNANTYIAELREVDPPIIASSLRFVPYSLHPKQVCMRVEVYGCLWRDGLVSYGMRQGEKRNSEIDLSDLTYDGVNNNGYLSGGLGQLVDGVEGQSNFRLDPRSLGVKGYEWIGWKNDSFPGGYVEIVFKFDGLRNFTSLKIHSNNLFGKEVRVFRLAQIEFSEAAGSRPYWSSHFIEYPYMRDMLIEYARPVIIPLQYHIGRYVKLQLFFDARWLLISEVQFESERVLEHLLPEDRLRVSSFPSEIIGMNNEDPKDLAVEGQWNNWSRIGFTSAGGSERTFSVNKESSDEREDEDDADDEVEDVVETSRARKSLTDEHIGIIIGALLTVIFILFSLAVILFLRHRKSKYGNSHRIMKCVELPRHVTIDANGMTTNDTRAGVNDKLVDVNAYDFMRSTVDVNPERTRCEGISNAFEFYKETFVGERRLLPCNPSDSSDTLAAKEHATVNLSKTASADRVPAIPSFIPHEHVPRIPGGDSATNGNPPGVIAGRPLVVNYIGHVQGTIHRRCHSPKQLGLAVRDATQGSGQGMLALSNIQGVRDNGLLTLADGWDSRPLSDSSVIEFPREKLKFLEKIGEGQFGEVHLCEALWEENGASIVALSLSSLPSSLLISQPALVAVKMLRKNATEQARSDFYKELKIMSRLRDTNIVRLIGVCTLEEPLFAIVEYMKYGDLNQFLRHHISEELFTSRESRDSADLSYGSLIFMASQIASGMKFMETLNLVHRDLATRNCLVGENYIIKISDFGMSQSLYSADYYTVEGRATLPVRWMAWESVILGKFSTRSDVWSFGVTMWEILTFAREQPLNALSNEQVIENFDHYYCADGLEVCLPQPAICPREIYDLMRECWNRDEVTRPSFREIHMFLQRKNMGYNPATEDNRPFETVLTPKYTGVIV